MRHTQAFDLLTGAFLAEARRGMRVVPQENIESFDVKWRFEAATESPKS